MDETDIAIFMLQASKFEFFLINRSRSFIHTVSTKGRTIVTGVNWTRVAQAVEAAAPFASFDFISSGFKIFIETTPQCLVIKHNGQLGWDSDDEAVNSWDGLLSRSYAQLRNNVAHGNKHQVPAPFT
ncbi:hypothetical protein ACWGTO_32330 [Mesorhizobium sp. PL10]